ncbi:DUF3850 domain-containing protein [Listeria booriae]|uniref:DUF3850 domain-containing protein n=1 Tax=Listeria booriae TaxID=1552123 RepID=UPI0016266955|nr:DUF3850 domain-containing protein [Listeria booriae]MBC1358295.1 DUF3850 domain-containing protein [Listeria booriae]
MTHNLKINSEYFLPIKQDLKCFEIRKNDRNYQVGDTVVLNEFFEKEQTYSGEKITVKIKYITDYNQKVDYVVFGFEKI